MDQTELVQLEAELRGIATEAQLGWVLAQVDEMVAQGVAEDQSEEDFLSKERVDSWSAFDVNAPALKSVKPGSSRTSAAVVNRPWTVRERVLTLLEALRRVLVELPLIEQDTLSRLSDISTDKVASVQRVTFEPDMDVIGSEKQLVNASEESRLQQAKIKRLLDDLRGEVES
ncbi:hypothetical protein [Lentzea nigeriaca]|uniref:hypothetical protein n=1 Tax=Lentzea nigeriaca TaxID=1128665 RepID=UPI00195BFB6E|nr:hypothetical protein [Lentzea nigeriaca]MBM7856230.1 hypothetical protein [Lentzea nigeriaca]